MDITTLGIDIAKSVFQLRGVNAGGVVTLQKKLRAGKVVPEHQGPICDKPADPAMIKVVYIGAANS